MEPSLTLEERLKVAEAIAQVAEPVAWPLVAIIILLALWAPLKRLLNRLADSLTLKSIKIKGPFGEFDLAPERVEATIQALVNELNAPGGPLGRPEQDLLRRIVESNGTKTVNEFFNGTFERKTEEHRQLGRLRDRMLVRPSDGGPWYPESRPVVTRFGELILELERKARLGTKAGAPSK